MNKRNYFKINKKGQVSLEILIVIGIFIIGAIGLGIILINNSNKATDSSEQTEGFDNLITDFSKDSSEYLNNNSNSYDVEINQIDPSIEATYSSGENFVFEVSTDCISSDCSAISKYVWYDDSSEIGDDEDTLIYDEFNSGENTLKIVILDSSDNYLGSDELIIEIE